MVVKNVGELRELLKDFKDEDYVDIRIEITAVEKPTPALTRESDGIGCLFG